MSIFHWSICPSLCQYHTGLISAAFIVSFCFCFWNQAVLSPLTLFFFFKLFFLLFHMNLRIRLSFCTEKSFEIFTGIALNLLISLERTLSTSMESSSPWKSMNMMYLPICLALLYFFSVMLCSFYCTGLEWLL